MQLTRQTLYDRQIALIEHYLGQLGELSQMFAQGHEGAQEALRRFDQDWQQLQAQQQWSVGMALRDKRAAQLVMAFPQKAGTLLLQIDPQDATEWLENALTWVEAEDFTARYQFLRTNYDIRKLKFDTDRMREIVETLAALVDRLNDDQRRAEVAYLTADYYDTIGDYDDQIIWSERALELALRLEDDALVAEARYALGFGCLRLQQYSRADELLRLALNFFQTAGMRLNESYLWNALALNFYYQTQADQAVIYAEQALAIVRELGHRKRELIQLSNLALFTMGAGDLEKALLYSQQALNAAQDTENHAAESPAATALLYTLVELGMADELNVQIEQIRKRLHETASHAQTEQLEVIIQTSLAYMAYEQSDWSTACQIAKQVALTTRDSGNGEEEYEAVFIWASGLIELGAFDEAAEVFSRGLVLYNAQPENRLSRAGALSGLSYVETQRSNTAHAQTLIDEFLSLLDEHDISNINSSFLAAWNAYRTLLALGDARAVLLMEKYEQIFQQAVSHLHDEVLRTSFLRKITIQRLRAVRLNQSTFQA